ncbi:MAG: TIGR03619 family F420-dependent LLM class oxidoreductase [Proteobacteria bacterium]|nr:TIGR03619 family F420-dependent LLM class oxidoreductase [Pseudomonadota bacterium]
MPKLGVVLRTMGAGSDPATLAAGARAAEAAGLDDLWVVDHIAIPPDDAEGSDGRYLDPLATLAYLAGQTERIGLGTSVLILPYRPPLPTAKWVATVQELSRGRLRLGVGVGWMKPEFRALGVERSQRGVLADDTLDFLETCFAAEDDVVERNGQRFLFRPHPERPPIFVGGAGEHALARAVRHGGWMPMGADPEKLAAPAETLRRLAADAGRPVPAIAAMGRLPLADPARAKEQLAALAELGVERVVHAARYADADALRAELDGLAPLGPN